MTRSDINKITRMETLIDKGNYRKVSKILSELDSKTLSDEERYKLQRIKSILEPDLVYIGVSIVLMLIVIVYFLIVKHL